MHNVKVKMGAGPAAAPKLRLRTLWLGETARTEFAAAVEVVRRETDLTVFSPTDEVTTSTVADSRGSTQGSAELPEIVDLIVSAESFPDEISPARYADFRRRHPSARWVRVVGPWCDGEVRSASPPPATLRIPWHRAAAWFERQFDRVVAGESAEFDDPPTFDEADRISAPLQSSRAGDRRPTFGIWAEEQAAREWLLDIVNRPASIRRGAELISPEESSPQPSRLRHAEIALCDLPTADDPLVQIACIRRAYPTSALIVLVGFARPADVRALYAAGTAVVLAKPVTLADLQSAIDAVAGGLPEQASGSR
jgi:hypothetical protein